MWRYFPSLKFILLKEIAKKSGRENYIYPSESSKTQTAKAFRSTNKNHVMEEKLTLFIWRGGYLYFSSAPHTPFTHKIKVYILNPKSFC